MPVGATLRIIRGELELEDALKEKRAREMVQDLIEEGFLPNIAGQIARGEISKEKARIVSDLLVKQGKSFYYSRLNEYKKGETVGLYLFDAGPVKVMIKNIAPYDMSVVLDDSKVPIFIKKHDIKLHFQPELLDEVEKLVRVDQEVKALGLSASVELEDRYRPTQEEALMWVSMPMPVKFVLRDGDVVVGRVVRCGKFEVELMLNENVKVYLMTHAILKDIPPVFVNE